MSSISKLQIRGIRSFGPDSDEVIQFYTPLTMIVGANGCGKTTIIESLKYCCTGSVPPNCKSGHSLVNDPGMTDAAEIKAHIKLLFKNRGGRDCLAVRSLQVTKKKAKTEFKALEGTIRTTNDAGQVVSSSYKCMDMDRLIPENLGVSPAILENVIFVHQEDSNWPMQESSVLKKKFDDIFESTRYTKALDELKKTKKDYVEKVKNIKVDLASISVHVENSRQLQNDLTSYQLKLQEMESALEEINGRLAVNENKLSLAYQTISSVGQQTSKLRDIETKIGEQERRIQDKTKSLERELVEVSDYDLQQMLSNFDQEMTSRQREMKSLKSSIDAFTSEITKYRMQMDELNKKKGQANALKLQMDSLKGEQVKVASEFVKRYSGGSNSGGMGGSSMGSSSGYSGSSMPCFTNGQWNARIAKDIASFLNAENQRVSNESQATLSTLKTTVNQAERAYNEAQGKYNKVDVELSMKGEEVKTISREIEAKTKEMNRLSNVKNVIQSRQEEYDRAKADHDTFMASMKTRSDELKRELKDVNDTIRNLQEQISNDSKALADLSSLRGELAAVDATVKQLESELSLIPAEIEGTFHTHRGLLKQIVPLSLSGSSASSSSSSATCPVPQSIADFETFLSQVNAQSQQTQRRLLTKKADLSSLKSNLAAKDALLSSTRERLQVMQPKINLYHQKEAELRQAITVLNELRSGAILQDSALDPVDFTASLEEVLQAAKTTEDEARELMIIAKAGKGFMKRLKKIRQRNPNQCPCCGQGMTDPAVVQSFETRTKALFSLMDPSTEGGAGSTGGKGGESDPISVEDHKEVLTKCSEVNSKIQALQVVMLPLQQQVKTEVIALESSLRSLQEERDSMKHDTLPTLEQEVEALEEEMSNWSLIVRACEDLVTKWSALEHKRTDALHKRKRLSQSFMSMSSSSSSMSYDLTTGSFEEFEREHQRHVKEKDDLLIRKDQLSNEESLLLKRSVNVQRQLADVEATLSTAKLDGSKAIEVENTMKSLQNKQQDIEQRRQELTRERESLQRDVTAYKTEYTTRQREYDTCSRQWQDRLESIKQDCETFNRCLTQYESLEKTYYQEMNLDSVDDAMERVKQMMSNKQQEIDRLQPQVTQITQEVNSQEHVKRNVQNNVDLRGLRRELGTLKEQLRVLQESMMQGSSTGGQGSSSSSSSSNSGGMSLLQQLEQAERNKKLYEREKQTLQSERDVSKGKLHVLQQNLLETRKKLASNDYRDVEERARKISIEYETTNLAVIDLTNYHSALEKALMNFHTLKIREINKIIRELWQMIYQGQDIDTIELESGMGDVGEDAAGGAATTTATGANKSYNYRVVMKKGGLPLDMRGRCSAGQKVLASVVIRLALAETFCLNCGILALDEPTTNLDEPNKAGLAQALGRLIVGRSKQQNFQLVCITHDEEFVQMMRTELAANSDFNLPEFYFRVFRSEDEHTGRFFSHIERIPWDEM